MRKIFSITVCLILTLIMALAGIGPALAVFAEDGQDANQGMQADAPTATDLLQAQIDEAGASLTITLDSDIALDKTLVIPEGVSVTIKDDGNARIIDASAISSAFDVYGTLIFAGTSDDNLVIKGGQGESEHGNIATLWGGDLVLESGRLVGGDVDYLHWYGGCIAINQGGSMTMSGGVLEDFKAAYAGYMASGVVMIRYRGDFIMSGGVIRNNTSCSTIFGLNDAPDTTDIDIKISGGEFADNTSYSSGSVIQANGEGINVEISGGHFHDNEAAGKGTVCILHGANATISDGLFENNKAKYGGALAFQGNEGGKCDALVSGGTYRGNSANSGGAIYINIDGVTLSGGDIYDNTAQRWGGGIYVNSKHSMLIKNALITNNTAQRLGGGLWCCPTGGATIRASEGVAIFDNNISEEPGAGIDIATIEPKDGNPYQLHLSDRVLGGASVKYYQDGQVAQDSLSEAVQDAARFRDKAAEASNITTDTVASYALKAVISDRGKAAAEKLAELRIHDNTALCGGGIGANGGVYSGYQPPDEENPDTWTLKVNKVWDESVQKADIKPVTIVLVINGVGLESVELSDKNDWQAEFENLPDPSTLKSITVKEKDADDFIVTYNGPVTDLTGKTISISVINAKEKEEVKGTTEPPKEEPSSEVRDEYEDEVKGASKVKSVNTGDESSVRVWAFALAATFCALLILVIRRQRIN